MLMLRSRHSTPGPQLLGHARPLLTIGCLIACLACLACTAGCGKTAPVDDAAKSEEQVEPEPPPLPPLTKEQAEELYLRSKARIEATAQLPEASIVELQTDLKRVANEAEDAHLRANASLLLGSLYEQLGDQRTAISFYRQAQELIPDEVGPYIVLALASSKAGRWDEAIAAQWIVVEMIPDDLVGWLLLGELHVKGGKLEEATQVYTAYEQRRKGLLDGLTLKQDGKYVEDEAERAACAEALAPAIDNGTALALMYALDSDPSPVVRERVATIMGEQRLLGYAKLLANKQATETDESVKQAITWAIAEIEREPVETAPGPIPDSLVKQVEAEVAAATAAKGEGETEGKTEGEAGAEGAGPEKAVEGGAVPPEGAPTPKPAPADAPK
jgi:tetratricopeptide (TPR) repeat protein